MEVNKNMQRKSILRDRSTRAMLVLVGGLLFSAVTIAQTLVLAQVTERPKKDFRELRPMVTYMAEQLSSVGITKGEVRLFSDVEELIKAVKEGKVHWITETSYTAARLIHEANAKLIVTKWKKGQKNYSSIIYTSAKSDIKDVSQLAGKTIAFENPESFSSYFIPRLYLESQGLSLEYQSNVRMSPKPLSVGYVFSNNEKNNVLWVDKHLVAAGVVNDGDWSNEQRVPLSIKQDLRVLYQSKSYPRAFEIVGPGLDSKIAEALRKKLLAMNDGADKDILFRYEKSTGFSPITPANYQQLSDVYQRSLQWKNHE